MYEWITWPHRVNCNRISHHQHGHHHTPFVIHLHCFALISSIPSSPLMYPDTIPLFHNPPAHHNLWYLHMSHYFNGLVQERHNSIANALELRLSCTNPLIYFACSLEPSEILAAPSCQNWPSPDLYWPTFLCYPFISLHKPMIAYFDNIHHLCWLIHTSFGYIRFPEQSPQAVCLVIGWGVLGHPAGWRD